jgi:hypothetical protein
MKNNLENGNIVRTDRVSLVQNTDEAAFHAFCQILRLHAINISDNSQVKVDEIKRMQSCTLTQGLLSLVSPQFLV